jgi:hypothetical protein
LLRVVVDQVLVAVVQVVIEQLQAFQSQVILHTL